jgi:DNA-binding response OmpR family regulator
MYAEFLRQCGFAIEQAHDGPEALAKAFSCHPHVIVTATGLAGMSGFDLCRVLRMDRLTSSISIVVVTSDTAADGRRALSAGADSVLPKACSLDALFREITQLLLKTQMVRDEARLERAASETARTDARRLERVEPARKRIMLNHVHGRHVTTVPTTQPPALTCPNCYEPLKYLRSYIGGVSARHPEQWDYFECRTGCGAFQYRHRTRKLRQIG